MLSDAKNRNVLHNIGHETDNEMLEIKIHQILLKSNPAKVTWPANLIFCLETNLQFIIIFNVFVLKVTYNKLVLFLFKTI